MDDDLKDLELELERLRPRLPSAGLENRIGAALASPNSRSGRHRWAPWLLLPIAAGVALAFVAAERSGPPERKVLPADFKPVAADNLLLEARDEGYVTLDDGTTARQVRQSSVDTITWKDPRSNASLVWSLPREEVRVVPVIFQ